MILAALSRNCPWVSKFQGARKIFIQTIELEAAPTKSTKQFEIGQALDQTCRVQSRGPERAHQTMTCHGDHWGRIADLRDSFEGIFDF